MNNIISPNDSINNATNSTYKLPFPVPVTIIFGLLASIVSLSTVAGNLLVITSFFVERALRHPTNYFIFSLAVTDLLIGIFSMNFYTLYLLLNYWPLGDIFCDLWLSLDFTACLTSQYTVFFITVDRFCSVHIPAKYRNWRTDNKVLTMIAGTWILPSLIFFTIILGWPLFTGDRGRPKDQCWAGFTNNITFNTVLTICYFWITLSVMCTLYGGIYHVALNLQKKSDAKRRKMASLVSMAGQTMSRIGVGVANDTNHDDLFDHTKPSDVVAMDDLSENSRYYSKDKNKVTSNNSKSQHQKSKKQPKSDERSSSPTFPSDSDIVPLDNPPRTNKQPPNMLQNFSLPPNVANIESPLILDDSPTASETSPFNFFQYGNMSNITSSTSSRFNRNVKRNTGAISAYSNDSDYQTASGFSAEYFIECRVQNIQNNISNRPSSDHGLQYIDSNNLSVSKSKLGLRFFPKEDFYSVTPDDDSPVWVKRTEDSNSSEDEKDNLYSSRYPNKDPPVTDTIVVSNDAKYEVIKIERLNFSNNTTNRYSAFARHSNLKGVRTEIRNIFERINFRSMWSVLRNAFRRLFYLLARRIRAKMSREPKEIIERGKTENRARKALKTITFILGAFVICWTPYHILVLLKGYNPESVNDHLYNLSYWLCYANSPINPFCYALANAQFKKAFLRLLRGDFHRT